MFFRVPGTLEDYIIESVGLLRFRFVGSKFKVFNEYPIYSNYIAEIMTVSSKIVKIFKSNLSVKNHVSLSKNGF